MMLPTKNRIGFQMVVCDRFSNTVVGLPDEGILTTIGISTELMSIGDDRDYKTAKRDLDNNFKSDLVDFFYQTVVDNSEKPKYYRDRKFLFINNHNVVVYIEDGYRLALYQGKHVKSFHSPQECVDFIWKHYVDENFRMKTFKDMSDCITLLRYNGTSVEIENSYVTMNDYFDQHELQFQRLKGLE